MLRNVQRAAEIVRGFKQLAVDRTSEKRREFLLDEVISEFQSTLQPSFRASPFVLETDLEAGLLMDSYPGPLGQVIDNILQNALIHGLAGREHGTVRVSCRALDAEHIEIVCSDDGVGMIPEVKARIFEAFFTTRFGQGGSGLGMQIVHSFVTGLLGGQVQVESEPAAGASFSIMLPRSAPKHAAAD
ncbi:sensor histidine kinase [Roseateles oligotrophus]|uniref:histidine kinase n=1 Tax=Roseateles oligotrophus TaxID=1769250 RepID=A0ABT2YII3_9BURK|nr:HAMP domain-containing sensor histidine kinase [Roseateles oligotrophus]MCV2369781.1 HAMP domain-containing histidine kinase [Roseateles oligotrophus]